MGNPEARLQRDIQNLVHDYAGYALKVHGNQYTPAGTPDLLACVGGHFVGMEVKTPSGVLSELQAKRLTEIREADGYIAVLRDTETANRFLWLVSVDTEPWAMDEFWVPEFERIGYPVLD